MHSFFGFVLLQSTTVTALDWYAAVHPVWAEPMLDDQRLGADLELHAIDAAVRRLMLLPPGAYLSVNAAPQTILDHRFAAKLAALGPAAARIVVEVTEHIAVADYDTPALAVQNLLPTMDAAA